MVSGYVGKLLRVNLTSRKIFEENMPEESVLKKYIGGFGLGLKILYDELPLGTSPLDPENPLIFMTGPLTGTSVPSPNNTTLTTLNYQTGFTVGRSHSHGFWGPYLKFAGYDGVIIKGASETPVYLLIHNGNVSIRDASGIWGKDTHETEDVIKDDVGELRTSVAAIGPAGENTCAGALIENDKHHSFAHSGVGAVMGSKKLKAIAVYGNLKIPVFDAKKLSAVGKKWMTNLSKSDVVKGLSGGGLARNNYEYPKEMSLCSAKNFTEVSPPEFGLGLSTHKITPKSCFKCTIACTYEAEITSGPYKGWTATLAGGGENLEGAASIVGVYESGAVFYLTDLNDRLGFESSTSGCAIALAMECYEKGLITKEDTDGLELRWGDAEIVETLLRKMAKREGWIGNTLAMGPKRAAEAIGGDAPKFAIHIKGAGINLHDWRASWGTLLAQTVGGGSGWSAPSVDAWTPEPDIGYPTYQDPLYPRDKPEAVKQTGIKKYWEDCIGVCWFATRGVPDALTFTAEALSSVTGWTFSPEKALKVGERMITFERVFNIKHGLSPADDLNISPRFLEPPPSGRAKGKSIKPYLEWMVREYYRLMGWDEKTGRPWRSTLKRLSLEDFAEDIYR